MEVMEKSRSKTKKKQPKQKANQSSSDNCENVVEELEAAAKDIQDEEEVLEAPVESENESKMEIVDISEMVENLEIKDNSTRTHEAPNLLTGENKEHNAEPNVPPCEKIGQESIQEISTSVEANAPKLEKEETKTSTFAGSYVNAKLLLKQSEQILKLEDIIGESKPKERTGMVLKMYPEIPTLQVDYKIKPFTEMQLKALYANPELEAVEQFTKDFVEAELKGLGVKNHLLYDLLSQYLQARSKLISNDLEIRQQRKDYEGAQEQLWTLNSSVIQESGHCADGNIVYATHTFTVATFHRSVYQTMIRALGKIRELANETHTLYSYTAAVLKLQIELYVQNVINTIMNLANLTEVGPVYLGMESPPQHILPYLHDLRLCISVLFQFQRKLIRDNDFMKETREWLSQLVFLLLRLSTWQDHLFVLNHVLRCPPGISSWASSFIQVPIENCNINDPFNNYAINHALSILALILSPVDKREQFLQEIVQQKEDVAVEALWVMVDSDGEEDEESSGTALRENDLVALLNQIPLDNLFQVVLQIKSSEQESHDKNHINKEYYILKFLSFSTTLLKLIKCGLKTYDQPRYHQFCKRLSRFIRHIVQYATDELEILFNSNEVSDPAMLERLQVEYDSFFLRAIYYLYRSEKIGAWQFLAVIPYDLISSLTLWKIFYFLHQMDTSISKILNPIDLTDYSEKVWEKSVREQFEEKLGKLEDDECYYLLNTFANMALARKQDDMNFIYSATIDLLHIGFICKTTQETCSKNVRILLTHITSKYPLLLSDILKTVKENMTSIEDLSIYLYEELPIQIWKPTDFDLDIISNWLLKNNIGSHESKLARMILSRLNWELVEENKLFLPYSLHCKIALLIAKAVENDQGYLHWAWQTAFRLRLHINDKGFNNFHDVKDIEHFDSIYLGIRNQQPLAAFLGVLISSWGHLVPLVCTKGFDQLLFLQTHQKHEAVLFALNLIVPLFIESQEALINLEKFQNILLGLLSADRAYIVIAKSYISKQSTIIEQFGNMIQSQIANYGWYNCSSPRFIVRLWINSLISVPHWNRDSSIMYLLDVIIKASFFDTPTMDAIIDILKDLLQCATPQEQSNSISSLFKWATQSTNSQNLLINTSLSSYPYLAFIMIGLEFEERERSTGLWNEILNQLRNQKGKINVDIAIKKAASKFKLPSFSSGSLCIFRWAQQAMDTAVDHPILALLWQKFFLLYLYRVPSVGTTDRGCVGDKFFEGVINFNFLKRIKKRLLETVDYYKEKTTEMEFNHLAAAKQLFYMSGLKVFNAFSLWLEEPRLQESSLHLQGLPPQYEPQLLNLTMQYSDSPWLEYVDYNKIKEEQNISIQIWNCANFRQRKKINQPLPNAGNKMESIDPHERIFRRLESYDTPKAVSAIRISKPIIPPLNITNELSMFTTLDPYITTVLQFAHNYALNLSEHKALDCAYQELQTQLYRSVGNTTKKSVPCRGTNKTVHCSGAAKIVINSEEARMNDHIDHQIQLNRRDYETLLAKLLQSPPQSLCIASVVIHQVINIIQNMKLKAPEMAVYGVELFYRILTLINEESTNFLPTKKLFTECLEKLGQSHINGVEFETPRLLNKILECPNQGMYLAPHFSPLNIGTANFLLMYSMITKGVGYQYDLLYSLLSKFDIIYWLQRNNPKLNQRSQLIELIMEALIHLGQEPPKESLILHEVYRKHLICIFQFQFPEHYGDILMAILKASTGGESDCISIDVWLDVLNCLAHPIRFELNIPMREMLRHYAQSQQLLHYQELLDTTVLLSRHFSNERLQYGLYGLYPKARNYIDVIALFLGMIGHSLLISALNTHQGVVGNKLCEKIWPYLCDMFAPWIVPYSTNNKDMANWMQQLTDDRAVLLPWIAANAPFAQKIVNVFFECILYIIQTLPACNNILSIVWHWYVTNFAHMAVKDHILNVIHQAFISLPWTKFWPTINDLELMLKVAEQCLPDCHTFLGHIFIEVPWRNWLYCLNENRNQQIKARVYHCLLILLVKLSKEPKIRLNSSEKIKILIIEAENFDWNILDVSSIQEIMDWYVMSCDSQVIFKTDLTNLDFRILHFLKIVCFYSKPMEDLNQIIMEKRRIFIKSFVMLITIYTNRHKTNVPSKEKDLINVVKNQLTHLEEVVNSQHEYNIIFGELLSILNLAIIRNSVLKCIVDWILLREGDGMAVKAILNCLGEYVHDPDSVAVLYETSIEVYFKNNVNNIENVSWEELSAYFILNFPKQNIFIECLINKGCIFTLHLILLQKIEQSQDYRVLLNLILQWITNLTRGNKIVESIENRIPLLWSDFLNLAIIFCNDDEAACGIFLQKFAQCLLVLSEQKEALKWGGILGAIGIGKQSAVTLQFRFLCKAVAGYILAQLPDPKGGKQMVRKIPFAPCTVGQPGGNTEVPKILLKLDFGQSQGKIKDCAEIALRMIQDPQNTIMNVKTFLSNLLLQLYMEPFLKELTTVL